MGLFRRVVFSALNGLVAQQQVLVVADQLFFKQAPGLAVFDTQQLDKTAAFDLVIQLADIAPRF